MAYRVEFRPSAAKSIRKLPRRIGKRLLDRAGTLAELPRPPGVKKLQGGLELYRIRDGNYRLVYAIDDAQKIVTITIVADRKDVYREL